MIPFFRILICIDDTNLHQNSSWTAKYLPVHPKCITFLHRQFLKSHEHPKWVPYNKYPDKSGLLYLFRNTAVLYDITVSWTYVSCIYARDLAKLQLKSSKMRRARGVNDSNDTFFIRFGYCTEQHCLVSFWETNKYVDLVRCRPLLWGYGICGGSSVYGQLSLTITHCVLRICGETLAPNRFLGLKYM